jgi:alpha-D-xyloside xylohydrolase
VQLSYATKVRDVPAESKRFTPHVSLKRVTRRGDTLNAPLLTAECLSPAEGVIGIRVTHHAGKRHPGPHTSRSQARTTAPARCVGKTPSRS